MASPRTPSYSRIGEPQHQAALATRSRRPAAASRRSRARFQPFTSIAIIGRRRCTSRPSGASGCHPPVLTAARSSRSADAVFAEVVGARWSPRRRGPSARSGRATAGRRASVSSTAARNARVAQRCAHRPGRIIAGLDRQLATDEQRLYGAAVARAGRPVARAAAATRRTVVVLPLEPVTTSLGMARRSGHGGTVGSGQRRRRPDLRPRLRRSTAARHRHAPGRRAASRNQNRSAQPGFLGRAPGRAACRSTSPSLP